MATSITGSTSPTTRYQPAAFELACLAWCSRTSIWYTTIVGDYGMPASTTTTLVEGLSTYVVQHDRVDQAHTRWSSMIVVL